MNNKDTEYLIYNKDKVLITISNNKMELPSDDHVNMDKLISFDSFLLKKENSTNVYLIDVDESYAPPDTFAFVSLKEYRTHHLEAKFKLAVEGLHLLNWSRSTKFCGLCGCPNNSMNIDRSKNCTNCNSLIYPQTSMAVITGILKDGKILLAHNANFPQGMYSLIAGFVELGETLENAVRREIMEEVGLKVKNIRYFGSQPWPFPSSMMIGFLADYDSEDIKTDDVEILDANWYSPDEFPDIPQEYSIARKIINYYKEELS